MSICINGLHTDVRMFCSLLFLPSLYHCYHYFYFYFLQLVLLVCKHLLSCTKQNAIFFHSKYFVTYLQTINSWKNFQACLSLVCQIEVILVTC